MTDGPPPVSLSTQPYRTSAEHLRDELARVDLLVRAQVVWWRMTLAETKPPQLWGMLQVSDAEIARYLAAPIAPPDYVPDAVVEVASAFWQAEAETRARIAALLARTPSGVDLLVQRARSRFALSDGELDVVLLCLLPAIDARYRRIFGYLQDDASKTAASAELLAQMVLRKAGSASAARAIFEPQGTLARNRLIAVGDAGSGAGRAVSIDDGFASVVLESSELDPRLAGIVHERPLPVSWNDLPVDEDLRASLRDFARNAGAFRGAVLLRGPRGSGRARAARAIAAERTTRLFFVDVERALRGSQPWELLVDLAYRDARLFDASLYFEGAGEPDGDERDGQRWTALTAAAQAFDGITFLAAGRFPEPRPLRGPAVVRFDFPVPHHAVRRAVWAQALPPEFTGDDRERLAGALATSFQLTAGQIDDAVAAAVASARRRSFASPATTPDDLHEASRQQSGHRLLGFARRIEPVSALTIDDVILNDGNRAQLSELMNRVRLRDRIRDELGFGETIALDRGLVALFAGPSGVGKTLSAELIASEHGRDLYKVDLSLVVSKWVGETEKHLSRIFDEAEDADAMLFFDECESLFGKRGETSTEASGRWANLQVNYLLQRIEQHAGIVFLATNLRKQIDDAFLRRIHVVIEFATPDAQMRFRLWKRTLPTASSAVSDDELRTVAERFALTGGSVKNASVDAGYRALAAGRKTIVLRDVLDAVAREYQKLARPITQGEFGAEFYGWALRDILDPHGAPDA